LLAADIYGAPVIAVCLHGGAWSVLTDTRFGLVWTTRLALALLLGLLLFGPAARVLDFFQLCAAGALIALLAFVGHSGATSDVAGQALLGSDIVHLIAIACWLGSLPALAMLLSYARHTLEPAMRTFAARATARFSVLATLSVAALLVSGVFNSWNLLGGPRDFLATDYGRVLLLKIALFVAMLAIAAVNRFRLTPRLATPAAMRALERNSAAETALGLCVLLFVGALGTMSPTGHVHVEPANIPAHAAFTHIHSSDAMADVTIDPGRSGRVNAVIRVLREDLSEFSSKSVLLTLDPPPPALPRSCAMRRACQTGAGR